MEQDDILDLSAMGDDFLGGSVQDDPKVFSLSSPSSLPKPMTSKISKSPSRHLSAKKSRHPQEQVLLPFQRIY